MKKITLFILTIVTTTLSFSQVQICLGTDATVCVGQSVQITNCNPGQAGNATVLSNPSSVSLSDDSWSGVINIGFPFNFYGTNYSQCLIGSNGLISFNTGNAGGYCAWSLNGTPVPTTAFAPAMNAAMCAYQDINPGMGGQILYQTLGTAPNRSFYVLYSNVPMFSSGECTYMCIILHETSNQVEYHIGYKPISTWNGGLAIQATQNNAGNNATATAGRNNTQWTTFQDGRLYNPTAPNNTNNYTVSQIPYKAIISGTTNYIWQNTLGQTFPYNNGVLNINNVQAGSVGYFLTVNGTSCSSQLGAVSDTSWITATAVNATASQTPDICTSGQGTVTVNPTAGVAPFTYNWPALGSTAQTVTNVTAGPYICTVTDALGCSKVVSVIVGDTPASFSSSSTLVSCANGTDGTATAAMTPPLGTVTYQWNDPNNQTTATATGLAAGNYTCTITSSVGCTGTVNVTVSEIPPMTATIVNKTDVTCNSGNNGVIEVNTTLGTPGYTYSWDNSTSTSSIANDLVAGTHTVTITDANNCVITITDIINEPLPLQIVDLTPDTQICSESDITLNVSGTGGSSPYIFTWYENGTMIGTGAQITVDPVNTNTNYCVELSEQCGSPIDDSCMLVYFPTPIVPELTPDKTTSCMPGNFTFENTSSNGIEIQTMDVLFSNNTGAVLNGLDSYNTTFTNPTYYSVDMTVTSIYGCVYTNSHQNIVQVYPDPIADFTFSANPTTIFETVVTMHEMASYDVIKWEWTSPYSTPSISTSTDPSFMFEDGVVGQYPVTLKVTTADGCTDTITKIQNVIPAILFYAPNTFTPDNDEFNQSWVYQVMGIDVYDFNLRIFNRWGELIWETNDPTQSWDGTYNGEIVQNGTYAWRATVKDVYLDDRKEFTGFINVLR